MTAWEDAVKLFRNGIKKIKSNDVEGWADLHKANEALKIVVNTHDTEPVQQSYAKLSESITKLSVDKKTETVSEILTEGVAFGKLLKENAIIAEEPVLEEDDSTVDDTTELKEEPVAGAAAILDTPVPPKSDDKPKSAYERGFCEARKMHMEGENPKARSQEIAESSLSKEPYSDVKRWMEGFQAGWAMEEQVKKDTTVNVVKEDFANAEPVVKTATPAAPANSTDPVQMAEQEFGKDVPNASVLKSLLEKLNGVNSPEAVAMKDRIQKFLAPK